jgi:hypothetical protein
LIVNLIDQELPMKSHQIFDEAKARLFSPNPLIRLEAAKEASPSIVEALIPSKEKWIKSAFGAANAWLVVVGPSPGKGPGGKVVEAVPPVLGEVHPLFEKFKNSTPFWKELFRLLQQGFHSAGLDADAALMLTMLVNLDITPEGDSKKIPQEKLRDGLPRLKQVLELTRCRMILALTKSVYDVIRIWKEFSEVGPELQPHDNVWKYHPKSRWLTCKKEEQTILLTKALQHPSKASFYSGHETEVSDWLGARIAKAVESLRS